MPRKKRFITRLPAELDYDPAQHTYLTANGEASEKATALLVSHLDEEQLASYEAERTIKVRGSRGGEYRITFHGVFNESYSVDSLTKRCTFCVHAYGYAGIETYYCAADSALAILLTIKTDEPEFLRHAVPYPVIRYGAVYW